MKNKYVLTDPLDPTNRPYALDKIAGIEMCWAYNRQYGTQYMAVMPTNLYAPGDNYDLDNSHVLQALLRKMHEAKKRCKWSGGMGYQNTETRILVQRRYGRCLPVSAGTERIKNLKPAVLREPCFR